MSVTAKVTIACGSTGPLGEMVHAQRLAEHLREPGIEVSIRAAAGSDATLPRPGSVPVDVATVSATADARARASELAQALEGSDAPDVVVAEDVVSGLAAIELRERRPGVRVIRTIHHLDATHELDSQEDQRLSVEGADACVCVSGYWAGRVREELGVQATVIANGVEHAAFAAPALDRRTARSRLGWGERPVVLSVGGVDARKGSLTLLEAFARARGRIGDEALLAIVGGPPPPERYLARFLDEAERLGVVASRGRADGASLVLMETLPQGAMPGLYRAADAFALPSTREGFGLAALEAAASGLPIVLSDLAVFRERFHHDADCLMVPVGDPGALSDALVRVVHDRELAGRLGAAAQAMAAHFTWSAAAAGYARLIEGLAGG